ncbi:MAG TPA: metallophosphoesterase [Vitreimonas sp.]|uniref:metallophosphoesterase n=1 Tax=Vitreimonas sp. TaxID=3069702 RepID=UPI002D2E26A8|nr:metallophosphoesterase [Vitreimonas sp.]HYD88563.1 metallophosphoesterase [Vitreimonas sp.]
MSGKFLLAQISDTHVRADDGGAAVRQLKQALAQARAYQADVILLTGDLVNDERDEEYAALIDAIADPPAPLYVLPGNHDDRARIRARLPGHDYLPREGFLSYVLDQFPVRIVAIDQIVPGETYGVLTEAQAHWLDRALAAEPEKPTLVALHHPPFPTHDLLFDQIGLVDADLFKSVISRHRQVTRVICGHHHRMAVGQVAHAPVIVAPSTSWVYGLALHPGQEIAPITAEQPGWMLHAWTQQGGFASHFMGLSGG